MRYSQWLWQRGTQRFSHLALTGVFLVGLLLVLQLMGIAPRQALVAARQAELEQLSRRLDEAQRHPLPASNGMDELPPFSSLTSSLATLHKLGRGEGIILAQVDYQLAQEGDSYWRYRITSQGEFTYPAVLRMLDKSMRALPNLSLDSMEIDRSTTNVGSPTTKIGMSLYFSKPSTEDGRR